MTGKFVLKKYFEIIIVILVRIGVCVILNKINVMTTRNLVNKVYKIISYENGDKRREGVTDLHTICLFNNKGKTLKIDGPSDLDISDHDDAQEIEKIISTTRIGR